MSLRVILALYSGLRGKEGVEPVLPAVVVIWAFDKEAIGFCFLSLSSTSIC